MKKAVLLSLVVLLCVVATLGHEKTNKRQHEAKHVQKKHHHLPSNKRFNSHLVANLKRAQKRDGETEAPSSAPEQGPPEDQDQASTSEEQSPSPDEVDDGVSNECAATEEGNEASDPPPSSDSESKKRHPKLRKKNILVRKKSA